MQFKAYMIATGWKYEKEKMKLLLQYVGLAPLILRKRIPYG